MELRQRRLVKAFIGLTTALTLFTTFFGMSALLAPQPASAAQTVPYKVNFQGRLTDNSGNILTDGLYNIKFRLFDALTVGSNVYQEDRTITATDKRIQVTNGLFNIQFGDVTALSPTLFSGAFPLFLEVELPTPATATCATNGCAVFTEGAMTPRQPLASSPYAFNSDTLDGFDSSALVQLTPPGQQTGSINVSGNIQTAAALQGATATLSAAGSLTVGTASSASGSIAFKSAGSANTVTLTVGATAASYALNLPLNAPNVSECLKSDAVTANLLIFGSCSSVTPTLQAAYDWSATPAIINLNTSAKDFVINSNDLAVDPNILFNLQCVTCSAGAGKYAVQDNGIDVFTVNPVGSVVVAPVAGQNMDINLAASSGVRVVSATAPTVDQVSIDNSASTGVVTANTDGLSVNYKGGAAAVEASGIRVDFTPGTTSAGTWSGMRIVAGTTGAVSGVFEYGLKLEGPTAPGAGTETAMQVGTGWDIGVDVQSGGLQLAAQTDPSAATAGNLRLYAKSVAGKIVLKTVGPAGVDTPLQNAFWQNNTVMWTPGAAVGLWQGTVGGAVGTAAIVLPTSTNFYTSMRRSTYAPATAAANIQNGIRSELMFFRGNVSGSGGFFAAIHFGTTTWTAGDRLFIGFSKGTTAVTTVNPSTLADMAGFGIDAGDTAISFMHNDAIGTATKDAIAGQPALASNQGYDAYIYMKPNDSTIYYRLDNANTGAVIVDTSTATDIANVNVMMAIHAAMGTGTNTTTTSAVLGINRIYVETDR